MENFQANIGAKIKDFMAKMKQVDRKVQETAMEATKPIGADISEFMWNLREVEIESKRVLKKGEKSIGADISEFMRKAAQVAVVARSLTRDKIIVNAQLRVNKFQATLRKIATNVRAFGELGATTFRGLGLSLSPALVPLIATLGGLIGQLGPMLGTVAGSTFALASAFGAAGLAAGAFTAIAVSNLKDVFTASADVKKIQEKLAMETDEKKRAELLDKMTRIQGSLNAEQTKAYEAMRKLKSVWSELSSSLEKPTIKIFTDFLGIMSNALNRLKPLFEGSVKAVQNLTTSLANAMKGERMSAFIEYMNTKGGPILEVITKAFGNFTQGLLSMMVAFGPLSESTSKGFLAMSESFATWAAGLGESKKFQSFVDYVNTNMPKIRSIFSDAFQGIINVFAAFAPSSSDMMTSLESMMERFKAWSSTLSTNKGFQEFIDYIKTNGPIVVDAIGNIVTSLVNIGIALAPMGEKILGMVNAFVEWTNAMMENHPIIGKIGAFLLVLSGVLLAIAPNIIAFGTLFGGASTAIVGAMTLIMAKTSLMRAKFILGMQMMVTSMLKTASTMVVNTAKIVAQWVIIGTKSTVQAIKVAAAWTLSTGKAMATSVGKMIATSAVFVAKWLWMGVQALAQAARMAAAWFIALGPIGWVTAAIIGLAILIIANWDKIKAKTIEIWTKVWSSVKEAAGKMVQYLVKGIAQMVDKIAGFAGKVLAFRSDMLQAGSDLIQGLIDGILNMGKKAIQTVKGLGGKIISAAKNIFDINSPSRVFAKIGEFVGQGLANGVSSTQKENEKVMNELGKVMRTTAKANSSEITKLNKQAEAEQVAIARKATADIAAVYQKARDNKRKLTATEVTRIAKIENDADMKIRANKVKHLQDMIAVESKAQADRLSAIQNFVDNKTKLEGLSAIQEANIWRKAADSFKAGTQEKIDAQVMYRNKLRQIEADIESTNEKYSQRMIDINKNLTTEIEKVNQDLVANSQAAKEKLIADEERLNDAYNKAFEDRYNSLKNFANLFDKFDMSPKESGSELLDNLQSQVDGFKSWEAEITKLSAKGINDGLLEELRDMGPKALPQLVALNSMTDEQLTKYSALYSEKSALARAEAAEQLAGMKADTQAQITELRLVTNAELARLKTEATQRIVDLRLAANAELSTLQTEWVSEITKLTVETDKQFKTLTQIGKDAVAGLIAGMSSMNGPLQKEAQRIASTVQSTIKKALQIHSPSRVLEKLGGFAGEGLIIGLSDSISAVASVSRQLAEAATPSLAGIAMAPLDMQPQMDALHRQIKQELSVDMTMNHRGSVGEGDGTGAPIVYVTIDAKNVKEFNDVVKIFDKQSFQRQ